MRNDDDDDVDFSAEERSKLYYNDESLETAPPLHLHARDSLVSSERALSRNVACPNIALSSLHSPNDNDSSVTHRVRQRVTDIHAAN